MAAPSVARASPDNNLVTPPGRRQISSWLCLIALVLSAVVVVRPISPAPTGKLTIYFLDVGQGDSALIVFPRGSTMLVDGGGEIDFGARAESRMENSQTTKTEDLGSDETEASFRDTSYTIGEAVVSRFVWSTGRTHVDYVLATHAHVDHIGGLLQVTDNFDIRETILGHRPMEKAGLVRLEDRITGRGIPLGEVSAGERFEIDGVTVEVLWPRRASQEPVTSGNNDSVVLRLMFGSVAVLMAGDIEQSAEDTLVKSGVDLRADVLKVPHHGSRTSSTPAFIDAVDPRCAVLSVGERSRFGHPNAEVVERYLGRSISLFQTGRDGTISVETDGATVAVTTYRK